MAKKAFLPPTGIEVIIGLPGSGKSFYMTRTALDAVLREQRPVYTNLPLKLRVIRKYLVKRGGPEAANLVQILTKDHFDKFLERFTIRAGVSDQRKRVQDEFDRLQTEAERVALCQRYPDFMYMGGPVGTPATPRVRKLAGCWAMWCEKNKSPDIVVGPDANYIPVSSIIMIDEVHHWFPGGVTGRESKSLVTFLTMHRHGFYHVYCATQHFGQVNVVFRRNACYYHVCQDVGLRKLALGFTFADVGLRHFGRYQFIGGQTDEPTFTTAGAIAADTFWAQFPWNSWVFRLYKSHTHLDSPRAAQNVLREARKNAGIKKDTGVAQRKDVGKLNKKYVALVAILCFVVGVLCGPRYVGGDAASTKVFPYKVTGVGDDFVQLDVGYVDSQSKVKDVMYVMGKDGDHVVLVGHDVWMLRGSTPQYVGPYSAVAAGLRARLQAATGTPHHLANSR